MAALGVAERPVAGDALTVERMVICRGNVPSRRVPEEVAEAEAGVVTENNTRFS